MSSLRSEAMNIATGFNAGLSNVKGSDIFDLKRHQGLISYLMYEDIYLLHELAVNPKYEIVSMTDRFNVYDQILGPKGFIRSHSGTNRVIYRNIYDDSFILKIGIDSVGIEANRSEFYNQNVLKPFVPKVYDISKCGTIALMEKVEPILNQEMFTMYANEIFNVIVYLVGQGYLLEDIGTDFFMNWGIRYGFGPVLLDFPYVYRVNKSRLFCTMIDMGGEKCKGRIVYDDGFNYLVCDKCGKRYAAKDIGSSFRYLTELNKKILRSEEAMDYVIKARNNSGSFEIKNGANVIVDKEASYNIMTKMDKGQSNVEKKESVAKQETVFGNKPQQDKFVKNNNLKIEQVLKSFNLTKEDITPDMLDHIEKALIVEAPMYIKVSNFIVRTKDVIAYKNAGKLDDQEERAKKVLHTNRIRIMENDLFTHYYSSNVYYDIDMMADVVSKAIDDYLKMKEEMLKDIKPESEPVVEEKKEEVVVEEPVKEKKKDLEMKISNGNALGNSTVTSKTAFSVTGVKPNTASEY